ncbi:MAG: septum formation initiator family protein [Actinobacteria bacterium]|nr:septum formation initiator family protein [Actinomycetota bacterium]
MVLAAVLLVLGISAAGPVRNFLAQRAEIDRLEERITSLEQERNQLEHQLERIRDPDELERLARECLGMVRPGEIAFANPEGGRAEAC